MRLLHTINVVLWCANSITWGAYAHSLPMAFLSLLAAGLAYGMLRMED